MTVQFSSTLTLEGTRHRLNNHPPLPPNQLLLKKRPKEAPDPDEKEWFVSRHLYGGYTTHWEIRDGLLFLNSISGSYELNSEKPIFARWVDTPLEIPPRGNMVLH